MFEKASQLKLRFQTPKGYLPTEDLWDLKLDDLDTIAVRLSKEIKEQSGESFIKTKTKKNDVLELQLEILKHIIAFKLDLDAKKALRIEKKQQKERLLGLIAEKEDQALSAKSVEELKQELLALDDED